MIRRSINQIQTIKTENNEWITRSDSIGTYFVSKYNALFTSSQPTFPNEITELIQPIMGEHENQTLIQIPSANEIKEVIKSMNSLKTPGLMGCQLCFIKNIGI